MRLGRTVQQPVPSMGRENSVSWLIVSADFRASSRGPHGIIIPQVLQTRDPHVPDARLINTVLRYGFDYIFQRSSSATW